MQDEQDKDYRACGEGASSRSHSIPDGSDNYLVHGLWATLKSLTHAPSQGGENGGENGGNAD